MRNRFGRREKREGYNLNGRYIFVLVVILGMFVYLFSGLAELQLRSSDTYEEKAESRRTTTVVLRGSRGMITDADAVILAKDEPIYNVTFYRDASQNSQSQYRNFTLSIQQAIQIIEGNGSLNGKTEQKKIQPCGTSREQRPRQHGVIPPADNEKYCLLRRAERKHPRTDVQTFLFHRLIDFHV